MRLKQRLHTLCMRWFRLKKCPRLFRVDKKEAEQLLKEMEGGLL